MAIIIDADGTARFYRPVDQYMWRAHFDVPIRLLTVNELLRMQWPARRRYIRQIAWAVHLALPVTKRPPKPLERASVRVERHGAGMPDPESLSTTIKPLLDVLQVRSRRHPYGLDIIADDTEKVIGKPEVVQVKAPRGVNFFRVWIEERLPDPM